MQFFSKALVQLGGGLFASKYSSWDVSFVFAEKMNRKSSYESTGSMISTMNLYNFVLNF